MIDANTLQALGRASSLELFHLSLIIERMMSDPTRILAIRSRLHLGQTVRFLDSVQLGAGMKMRTGRVIALRDTTLSVHEEDTHTQWKLPYAAVEIAPTDEAIEDSPSGTPEVHAPQREDFRVGDRVSFEDRYLQSHVGTIVRINRYTASVRCDDDPAGWRVPFPKLRLIVDL